LLTCWPRDKRERRRLPSGNPLGLLTLLLAPRSLTQLVNHFKGAQVLSRLEPALRASAGSQPDLRDIKGQESTKRALEVAPAGGHDPFM
jgi:magnesium chelatase family protein